MQAVAIAAAALATWIAITVSKAIYNAFFHPLRDVPGPTLAKITEKYITSTEFAARRSIAVHELHEKYGPVVRVGPNELAFADPALIKEIYSQGTPYMKAPMYATFRRTYPTLFDMIDRDQHSQRRKLLSHAHAKSSVDEAEPLIAEQIAKFVEWMRKMEGTVVNVQVWYRMLALDITGSLFMGEDFGALESGKEPAYLDDADHFLLLVGLRWQMPYLLPLFSWVPIPSWQRLVNSEFLFFDYGDKALARYIQRYGREPKRKDLLKKIILGDETVSPLTDAEIGEELSHLIFAGTDTTSGTLTFICWELTRQPGWQTSLRKELRAAKVGFSHGVPKYKDVANLEILNAVITEGLRVHGPVPSGLPRVVPKEGAKLGGHFVPGGTIVSVQSYTTQRNPIAFPSPEVFDPSRWLLPAGAVRNDQTINLGGQLGIGTPAMREAWMPFSKGSRGCAGIHLATVEFKLILATVINGWNISAGARTTDETMAMKDQFVTQPMGGFCDLVFTPVKE